MSYLFLLGRVLFGGFFLMNAYKHFANVNSMAGYAQARGVPSPKLAVAGSGVLLLIGGLSVITGAYPTVGIAAIVLFLLPVTFSMHAHWKIEDAGDKMMERIQFYKNIALLGAALMMLAIPTPWVLSL